MTLSSNTTSTTGTASIIAPQVHAEAKIFDFTGFDHITVSAGIDADIVSGPEFSVKTEARSAKALRRLDIDMRGHTLCVTRSSNFRDMLFGGMSPISLTITLPVLRDIAVSSGTDAPVSGHFEDGFSGSASSGAALESDGMASNAIDLNA